MNSSQTIKEQAKILEKINRLALLLDNKGRQKAILDMVKMSPQKPINFSTEKL